MSTGFFMLKNMVACNLGIPYHTLEIRVGQVKMGLYDICDIKKYDIEYSIIGVYYFKAKRD